MTKVIFRREFPENGGQVLAVFPTLAGDNNPYTTCLCYSSIEQHSAMSLDYFKSTFPLTQEHEYIELLTELYSIGYELEVMTRMSRKDLQERISRCHIWWS